MFPNRLQSPGYTPCWFRFLGEVFEQLILQTVLLALVVGFHQLQLGNFHIQIHALLDTGVSGTQSLDFGKGKRRFIHIVAGTDWAFAGHNLADEFLFVLHRLPEIRVKSPFSDIAVHMNKRVFVALSLNASFSLGKVSGPPRAIQIMERHKAVLHIGSGSHLLGATQKDPHLPSPYFGEQFLFRTSVLASWIKAIWSAGIPGR